MALPAPPLRLPGTGVGGGDAGRASGMLRSVLLQRAQGLGVACGAGSGLQLGSSIPGTCGRQEPPGSGACSPCAWEALLPTASPLSAGSRVRAGCPCLSGKRLRC